MANAKEYDVLIVGSGHSGGMAANILSRQGLSCLRNARKNVEVMARENLGAPAFWTLAHTFNG
jgi:flavin-dependent dehydrogenase